MQTLASVHLCAKFKSFRIDWIVLSNSHSSGVMSTCSAGECSAGHDGCLQGTQEAPSCHAQLTVNDCGFDESA